MLSFVELYSVMLSKEECKQTCNITLNWKQNVFTYSFFYLQGNSKDW